MGACVNLRAKTFPSGGRELTVLDDVSFSVDDGETCAIVGPSGSGKTTLLGLCAGLDRPTRGTVTLCGVDLSPLDEDERAEVRNQYVGFVFQTFRLLPTLTAIENVMVPAELRGTTNIRTRAADLLAEVGLGDRIDHYERIEDLLFDLNRTSDTTLVLVTHDLELAERTERVLKLRGGKLEADEMREAVMGNGR